MSSIEVFAGTDLNSAIQLEGIMNAYGTSINKLGYFTREPDTLLSINVNGTSEYISNFLQAVDSTHCIITHYNINNNITSHSNKLPRKSTFLIHIVSDLQLHRGLVQVQSTIAQESCICDYGVTLVELTLKESFPYTKDYDYNKLLESMGYLIKENKSYINYRVVKRLQ